jgi:hypothetical protein
LNLAMVMPPKPEPVISLPPGCDVSRLSGQEFELIETFLSRRGQLAHSVRMQMARKIAERIASKLELGEQHLRAPERLLEVVAAECRNRPRFR